ncbi:MAG: 23S rRNA (uracil1939-C5)-methyltransferase, partial [Kiritimatiellia bacterium]
SGCGGCDLDELSYEAQLTSLARMAQRALRLDAPPTMVASPRRTAHRARIKLAVRGHEAGYRAARSHDLVRPDLCRIARPEVQVAHQRLLVWLADHGSEGLDEVEIRSDGARVVYAFTTEGSVPRATRQALSELGPVALDGRRVDEDPNLTLLVRGLELRAGPRTFYQVNLEANELIVDHVLERVNESKPERTLDLYSGIGNFSLPLAVVTGAPVLAVEREGQAIEDLKFSAERGGVSHLVRAITSPVERFDATREPFDVVVLDPPRVGAAGVVQNLVTNRPRRMVYVSCHVPAAARDLKPALDAGYRISNVTCFDLFPDTHHFETVITLDRGPARAPSKPRRSGRRRR